MWRSQQSSKVRGPCPSVLSSVAATFFPSSCLGDQVRHWCVNGAWRCYAGDPGRSKARGSMMVWELILSLIRRRLDDEWWRGRERVKWGKQRSFIPSKTVTLVPQFAVEGLPLDRTAALIPAFAMKDLPLGITLWWWCPKLWNREHSFRSCTSVVLTFKTCSCVSNVCELQAVITHYFGGGVMSSKALQFDVIKLKRGATCWNNLQCSL